MSARTPSPLGDLDAPAQPALATRILEVSLRHIVDHGYDGTSVRLIAGDVGVTVPAIYYHFANKQALLVALLDRAMTLVTNGVDAALQEAGDDPAARLEAIVRAIVLYMADHRELAFLDSERRALLPENLATYLAGRDRIDAHLRSAIEDGVRTGAFTTPVPTEARRAILSMAQGIAGWFRPDGTKTAAQTADDYVTIALAAVGHRG